MRLNAIQLISAQLSLAWLSPARFFKFCPPLKMDPFTNDFNCAQAKFVLLAAPTSFSSQLSSAQLSSAQFHSAQSGSAQPSSVQFSPAQLNTAQLSSAQLTSPQLASARLNLACFFRCFIPPKMGPFTNNLNCAQEGFGLLAATTPFSAQLSPAQLSSAQLNSAQLRRAQLSSAHQSPAQLSATHLSSAQLNLA